MEFSVFISHMRIHPPEYYGRSLFAEKLIEAKAVDRLGYDCIWIPEHHLIHFMQAPSGLMLCLHYGQQVSCPIGQMVNLLTYRHPLIAAGELALADVLLDGRLLLGVGRGAYEYEFQRLEIPFATATEQFLEALDILELAWRSEDEGFEFHGKYYDIDTSYVWPRPIQKPHPEIWYAAMSPASIEFCAKRGYHAVNWPFLRPMSFVRDVAERFHEAREKAGNERGVQKLAIMRGVMVAETESKARRSIEPMLINHRLNQRLHHFDFASASRGYIEPVPLDTEPSEQDVFDNMIIGTPAQCLEKLHEYEELGVDQFLLWFDYGPDHEAVLDAMEMFAAEVMAPFRRARGILRPDHAVARTAAQ